MKIRVRRRTSIFVRKTLRVLPCEIKKALAFLARRKDLRFSMKMMFAAGFRNYAAAFLNCDT